MSRIIAIDPGWNGGIAYWNHFADSAWVERMPDTIADIDSLIHHLVVTPSDIDAYVENQTGGGGVKTNPASMFKFGTNFGAILGILASMKIRTHLVMPAKWMKALSLGTRGGMTPTQWKNKLKAAAQRLYPDINVTLTTADALLLLEYARNNNTYEHK